jgi:5-methylcytosine-specific restriction endonuclease McrA
MPINYKNYPSNWKTEIRPAILERAGNKCEFCGVLNYAVGYRDLDGIFQRTAGNEMHDKAGYGELKYSEALSLVKHCNDYGEDDYKLIIIILTIAHLDHDITNNDYSNLKALCQQCHNRYDRDYRNANRKNNRNKGSLTLFE